MKSAPPRPCSLGAKLPVCVCPLAKDGDLGCAILVIVGSYWGYEETGSIRASNADLAIDDGWDDSILIQQ